MRYAILDDKLNFVEWRSYDELPPHKDSRILPEYVDPFPSITSTQHIVEDIPVVEKDFVRSTWKVLDYTPEELAEINNIEQLKQLKTNIRTVINKSGSELERINNLENIVLIIIKNIQ